MSFGSTPASRAKRRTFLVRASPWVLATLRSLSRDSTPRLKTTWSGATLTSDVPITEMRRGRGPHSCAADSAADAVKKRHTPNTAVILRLIDQASMPRESCGCTTFVTPPSVLYPLQSGAHSFITRFSRVLDDDWQNSVRRPVAARRFSLGARKNTEAARRKAFRFAPSPGRHRRHAKHSSRQHRDPRALPLPRSSRGTRHRPARRRHCRRIHRGAVCALWTEARRREWHLPAESSDGRHHARR